MEKVGGGDTQWEGVQVKFYSYKKEGGSEKDLAMLNGGHKKCHFVAPPPPHN